MGDLLPGLPLKYYYEKREEDSLKLLASVEDLKRDLTAIRRGFADTIGLLKQAQTRLKRLRKEYVSSGGVGRDGYDVDEIVESALTSSGNNDLDPVSASIADLYDVMARVLEEIQKGINENKQDAKHEQW